MEWHVEKARRGPANAAKDGEGTCRLVKQRMGVESERNGRGLAKVQWMVSAPAGCWRCKHEGW